MPATGISRDRGRRGPAISAHRGGSETALAGTAEAYRSALAAGADYAEFDVRRCADGTLVALHAASLRGGEQARLRLSRARQVTCLTYPELCDLAGYVVPRTADVLELIAAADAAAHIDLKDPAAADQVVAQALSLLDPARIIVTTRDQPALRYLRHRFPGIAAGATIGGDLAEFARYAARRTAGRVRERLDDVIAAGATWAVLNDRTASPGLLARCRQRGLATMIWTVNTDYDLRRLLASPLVDVLVTDRPGAAIRLRGSP